ncbi:MAG: hypothetical protein AAF211_10880 [Myxococcota bacterium]
MSRFSRVTIAVAVIAALSSWEAHADLPAAPDENTPLTDLELIDGLSDLESIEHLFRKLEHVFPSEMLDDIADPALHQQLSQIVDIDQMYNFRLYAVDLYPTTPYTPSAFASTDLYGNVHQSILPDFPSPESLASASTTKTHVEVVNRPDGGKTVIETETQLDEDGNTIRTRTTTTEHSPSGNGGDGSPESQVVEVETDGHSSRSESVWNAADGHWVHKYSSWQHRNPDGSTTYWDSDSGASTRHPDGSVDYCHFCLPDTETVEGICPLILPRCRFLYGQMMEQGAPGSVAWMEINPGDPEVQPGGQRLHYDPYGLVVNPDPTTVEAVDAAGLPPVRFRVPVLVLPAGPVHGLRGVEAFEALAAVGSE